MIDLETLLERAGRHARRILVDDQEKSLCPFFHLIATPPQQDAVVMCRWASEPEKIAAIAKTRELAHAIDAQALVFVGEAWIVVRHTPTSWHRKRALEGDPPSQQPDRKEYVVASATDGRQRRARMWEIVRSRPGGAVIALVEGKDVDGRKFESRLTDGILPQRAKTQ